MVPAFYGVLQASSLNHCIYIFYQVHHLFEDETCIKVKTQFKCIYVRVISVQRPMGNLQLKVCLKIIISSALSAEP